MTIELRPFAPIEDAVRGLLLTRFDLPEDHIGVEYPGNLADVLDYVRIESIGGSREKLETFPQVDVETFTSTRSGAVLLSERIDAFLLSYPHSVMVDTRLVILDRTTVVRSPAVLPWGDSNIRRFAATYQFSVRR